MGILNIEDSLLFVVDIQERLLNAVFNKEEVDKNTDILAHMALALELPVFITEQYPKGLGNTVHDFGNSAKVFEKTAFNALTDEILAEELRNIGKKQIILCGIEAHICVHQTAHALIERGFEVHLVKDACGSRSKEQYDTALSYMKDYGVNIKTTEMVLFELLKGAKHPKFKEIQGLIK